jgi:hypothetical protein
MRKAIVITLVALVGVAGWAADTKLSLLGKWELTTLFSQYIFISKGLRICDGKRPYIFGLLPSVNAQTIARINEIEFIDSDLAILTTTKGTTKSFYSIGPGEFKTGVVLDFELPNDLVFAYAHIRFHCFMIDVDSLRFSYFTYFRASPSSKDLLDLNFLGEMKRKNKFL